MNYKAIILDIDGTLVCSDKTLSKKNKEIIIKAQKQGYIVILATGRPTFGVLPIAKELQLEQYGGYVLSFNGGTIWDCANNKPIFEQELPQSVIPHLYSKAKKHKIELISYDNEYILAETNSDTYIQKEAFLNKMEVKVVKELISSLPKVTPKCLMVAAPETLIAVEQELKSEIGHIIEIYRSEPYFLELVPQGIDKAASIARLMEILEIEQSATIACGDGFNDLTMIKWAGLGVAMQNAQEAVKEHAQYIAPSNDNDGVAHIVEKYLLN